jgi:hypothetical protein
MLMMSHQDFLLSKHATVIEWIFKAAPHRQSSLFFQAYLDVTDTTINTWWSSQLFVFILPLVVCIYQYRSECLRPTLYLWISFIFAVSFGLPLFLVAILPYLLHDRKVAEKEKREKGEEKDEEKVPWSLFVALIVCYVMLCYFPVLRGTAFNICLVASHAILLLAIAFNNSNNNNSTQSGLSFRQCYLIIAGISLLLHAHNTVAVASFSPSALLAAVVDTNNHAIHSVCLDLFFTTFETILLFVAMKEYHLIVVALIFSPTVAFSLFLFNQPRLQRR